MRETAFMVLFFLTFFSFGKSKKINPFHQNIQACFGKKIDTAGIDTIRALHKEIENRFTLLKSELVFRETVYKLKGESRKLKFDGSQISVYSVDEEEHVTLLITENVNEKPANYELRYKNMSVDSRLGQHLLRADIKSDYVQLRETRAQLLRTEITRIDDDFKSLKVFLDSDKKVLECVRKSNSDICACKIQ